MIRQWLAPSALLVSACSSATVAEGQHASVYHCSDGRTFSVSQRKGSAEVVYYDERYRLPRRSSALGTRYASLDATLIIDGDVAVFVTENIVDLQACRNRRA